MNFEAPSLDGRGKGRVTPHPTLRRCIRTPTRGEGIDKNKRVDVSSIPDHSFLLFQRYCLDLD
jgi:hypothetical protein